MIIGCLGKGGSGKSTLATLLTKTITQSGDHVLAIDADHNMDFSFNLGAEQEGIKFLGSALPEMLSYCGLKDGEKYTEIFFREEFPRFSFTKDKDSFTQAFTQTINDTTSVMIAGPHTDNILHGSHCSHSLVTPLKVYLPFLELAEHEFVVIDEKAGSDGAGAGICTGFDAACVVVEPTRHGVKAAEQICELLKYYDTPFVFVGNKVLSQVDVDFLNMHLPQSPVTCLPADQATRHLVLSEENRREIKKILFILGGLNNHDRQERSLKKITRNKQFAQTKISGQIL
ncbi:AAA family ATPase [Patescibacteria group bacterium]|nr:AAA family ATPase [Patescibacteria group bacterium]